MSGTTNRIQFDEAADLLSDPSRACIGFVSEGHPRVEPAIVSYQRGRFLIETTSPAFLRADTTEVVLVVDDGVLFFDLRAVYVRGAAESLEQPNDGTVRFVIAPTNVSCWDYGRLRVVDAGE